MDFFVGFLCNENLLRVLYSGIGYKLIFKTAHGKRKMRFVYTQEKKISRVSRGAQPLGSGSSNRDERIPVGIGYPKGNSVALGRGIQRGQRTPWHTILLAKSSVLYLCGADGSRKCSTALNLCCDSGVLVGKVAP